MEYLETQYISPRTQVKGLYLDSNKTQHPRINSLFVHLGATGLRLNCHVGILIAVSSLGWGAHLSLLGYSPTGNHPALSAFGGLELTSCSIRSSDIAHHHVAIGVIALVSSSLYTSVLRGLAHKLRTISSVHGRDDASIQALMSRSLHLQLCAGLALIASLTSIVAQVIYSLPAYPWLVYDTLSSIALYAHHSWIGSLLMVGSFVHGSIFVLRDFTFGPGILGRLIATKYSLLAHLSWVSTFLGFHVLALFMHNDCVSSFARPWATLGIEPVLCEQLEILASKTHSVSGLSIAPFSPSSSSGDFLASHACCFGLHVSLLVILKASLDSLGSRIIPDKSSLNFGYACDGPSRGGTCDVSSWDAFYLGLFWVLNTIAWGLYYVHWKLLTVSPSLALKFAENSLFLNGWFRDYLWLNSSPLLRGYDSFGTTELSVWSWLFLAAHLVWATGFMFLISWRGYWQELIEAILYMHIKSAIVYDLWSGSTLTPVALSIMQARSIGLFHFVVGFIATYAAFIISASA
mmetsp:Transcript_92956/g.262066  ORF Transcript_92956/g.262066 Transcript_92956/m.262066 type:complete len:519 (-) Transcript_92956:8-1564(-)